MRPAVECQWPASLLDHIMLSHMTSRLLNHVTHLELAHKRPAVGCQWPACFPNPHAAVVRRSRQQEPMLARSKGYVPAHVFRQQEPLLAKSKGNEPVQGVVCMRMTVVQLTAGAHAGEEQRICACTHVVCIAMSEAKNMRPCRVLCVQE
eukprot:1028831-Pelagomonas_calceolata.AAC.2